MYFIFGVNMKGIMCIYILIMKKYIFIELCNMICKFLYIKEEKRVDIVFLE